MDTTANNLENTTGYPMENQTAIDNHKKVAGHYEEAAKHHRKAAQYHEANLPDHAAQSTVMALGQLYHAIATQREYPADHLPQAIE
jgi:hypothetical protein